MRALRAVARAVAGISCISPRAPAWLTAVMVEGALLADDRIDERAIDSVGRPKPCRHADEERRQRRHFQAALLRGGRGGDARLRHADPPRERGEQRHFAWRVDGSRQRRRNGSERSA